MKNTRSKTLRLLKTIIEENRDFVLFTHQNPDGDAIGSILAFYYFLEELNKNPTIYMKGVVPYFYEFLLKKEIKVIKEIDRKYKVGIVFDSSDKKRITEDFDISEKVKVLINIDHHPTNSNFGDINIVNPEAASVTEMIYDIIKKLGYEISINVAECILTGLITDTGSFKFSNTNYKSLKIASELVKKGVNISKISKEIYEKRKMPSLKLMGIALSRLQLYKNIGWSFIEEEDMKINSASQEDIEGIIDLLRTLKEADLVVLFYPYNKEKIKVSLRSKKDSIDVSKLALNFGGGGHKEAAGFQIEKTQVNSYDDFVKKIDSYISSDEWVYTHK